MTTAVIDGQAYRFGESTKLAQGGEADVHRFTPDPRFTARFGNGPFVVKLFFETNDAQRRSAVERQTKLQSFPRGLPDQVVQPLTPAYDPRDTHNGGPKALGYVMPFVPDATELIQFKSAEFAKHHPERVQPHRLCRILVNLHDLVTATHACGMVIGDLNDQNILVGPNDEVYLLEADGFQDENWECPAFMPELTDPEIIQVLKDPKKVKKIGKQSTTTDWYAFTAIAFQLLTRLNPYLSGYHPLKGYRRIQKRISVYHPKVTLPDTSAPLSTLPEELDRFFRATFVRNERGEFPRSLLTESRWQQCGSCGTIYGRQACPKCSGPITAKAAAKKQFRLAGRIIAATSQGGGLQCVYYDDHAYRREDREAFWTRAFDPTLLAFPAGSRTVMASGNSFTVFDGTREVGQRTTQQVYGKTTVAANSENVYWLDGSSLVHDDAGRGTVVIGSVVPNRTSVWVGERFGLAMSQAGALTRVHTFDASRPGMTSATLPPILGKVIDAHCVIGDDLAWLIVSVQATSGRVTNRCYVFNSHAQLQGSGEANRGGRTWLGHVTPAAHASGRELLVPVPRAGIVRIEMVRGMFYGTVHASSASLLPDHATTVRIIKTPHGAQHISTTTITPLS